MEAEWQATYAVLQHSAAAAGPSRRRPRAETEYGQGYEQAWMRPRSQPRLLPCQRAAQRQQGEGDGQSSGGQQQWAPLAVEDPLAMLDRAAPKPPWQQVWGRLRDRRLPRLLRTFGWRLLHGALACGAARAHYMQYTVAQRLQHCKCSATACQQQPVVPLETLSHMLLQCPVIQPAAAWLQGLWQLLEPQHTPPPLSSEVWLLDDHRVWRPASIELRPLWTFLRLTLLYHVWAAASARSMDPQRQFTAASVVAATVAATRGVIKGDWLRCTQDVRALSGGCVHWFRGRDPSITEQAFEDRWCHGGVLATTFAGRLRVRLSLGTVPGWTAAPAAVPGIGVAAGVDGPVLGSTVHGILSASAESQGGEGTPMDLG